MLDARKSKIDELLDIVELFNGAITLNDILNQDIPIITALKDAKLKRVMSRQQGAGKK